MTLTALQQEVKAAITEGIKDARINGEDYAIVTVNTNDGYIDISTSELDNNCAMVYHDVDLERTNANLEAWVENLIPDWWDLDVEDSNVRPYEWGKIYA
jgi:hypothetical protein